MTRERLEAPSVRTEAFGDNTIMNLGSCIVYLQSASKTPNGLCQVINTKGYSILGRDQAKCMNYINYKR